MVESNAVIETSRGFQGNTGSLGLMASGLPRIVSVLTHDQQLIQIGWSYRCYGIAVR